MTSGSEAGFHLLERFLSLLALPSLIAWLGSVAVWAQCLESPARQEPEAHKEGGQAVLNFERSFRGPRNPAYGARESGRDQPPPRRRPEEAYPHAKPIPLVGLENIVSMTFELWTPQQLEADFETHRVKNQEAILVIVKSELCHRNQYRICAAATAALEKRSTPVLAKFRVYGAWIRSNPGQQGQDWLHWENEVAAAYHFEQGPGAKLIVIIPGVAGGPFETSARDLGLAIDELEENQGRTPELEAFLNAALEGRSRLGRRSGSS